MTIEQLLDDLTRLERAFSNGLKQCLRLKGRVLLTVKQPDKPRKRKGARRA